MYLTVREVAKLLACTERQVYRWVGETAMPFHQVREELRFNRTDILEWAVARRLPISLEAFDADLDPEDRAPSLAQALRVGGVHHDVPATDRDSALAAVVERTPIGPGIDRELLLQVLVARRRTVSLAIGDGIAIPHVRQPIVAPGAPATVSVSYLRTPVRFGPADDEPVRIVFLILSPTIRAHLQLLARVARALLDPELRAALARGASTEELAAAAARLEDAAASEARHESGSRPA
jgi:PTS system nitrogen regulatory IIA component